MAHADEGWWDVASKTGNNVLVGVRDLVWSTYMVVAELISTVVYHMFNVDLLQMLMPNLSSFASSTAGQIINNLLILGMAFVGLTITIRGFIKQDWGAFFKILLLSLVSLTLLFSIQSEKFNYIGLVDSVSKDIENALIATPPSLITGQEIDYGTTDTAINMENRVYNALLLQPYLDLQYGDTSISRIDADREENYQVYDYLNSSPFTDDGQETREEIAKYEFETMENNNVNSANASTQIGKVVMYFISLLVQGFIYIVLAAIRYMLQIGMIIALVMLPIVLFLSLFPSFEKIILSYTRKIFQLVLYKAILVFYMIFVMAIMQITYTIQNYGMVQAIVFQVILAISCIMLYFYRNSAMDTVSDSSSVNPSEASGQGFGRSMNNIGNRMKASANKQSSSNGQHAKDFKESEQRGSQNKFKEGTETGNTQSSVRRNTSQNDNQDMSSQQNQTTNERDNVTSFSEYQDKKKQQEEQTQQTEDKVRNNQNENSQFNSNEESDMRRSDKYKSDTEDMNTNKNENQQKQTDRQQNDSRNVESSSYRSEQTAKDNQTNKTDNKQTLNNEQNNRSNNTENAQTTSTARNSATHKFEKSNQEEHNKSKENDRKPLNQDVSNARNSKNHEAYSSPLPGKTDAPNNKNLSASRNSEKHQSKKQKSKQQQNKSLNRKSAMNKSARLSHAKEPNLNQSKQNNQSKKHNLSPQRKSQMLKSQQNNNPNINTRNENPKKQQARNNPNVQKQQQRKNRNIKHHVKDSINEMDNQTRPVQQKQQPPKEQRTHQKADMKQQHKKTSSKKTSRTTDRQKTFNEYKNK